MVDYTQDIDDVKTYYANLLIFQYRSKPKARETVKMGVDIYMGDNVLFQLQDILDIDTAEGAPLDIIGKILGCPRAVQGIYTDLKYFQYYLDENSIGFSTVGNPTNGTFKTIRNYNLSKYSLLDEDYRFLLKFKAAVNVMKGSMAGIDEVLWNIFNGDVLLKNNQDLTITYLVSSEHTPATLAAKQLGYYRAPEGIGANYVLKVPSPSHIFGFNRKGIINNTVVGYSTKNHRQKGTWLTKENMISLISA